MKLNNVNLKRCVSIDTKRLRASIVFAGVFVSFHFGSRDCLLFHAVTVYRQLQSSNVCVVYYLDGIFVMVVDGFFPWISIPQSACFFYS